MPIEFSAAAYRFGHSMVRPIYRLNTRLNGGDDPLKATPDEIARGLAGRFFIFAGVQRRGLNGFDEFPQQWAIDWSLYFDIKGSIKNVGNEAVQPAYKIDTSLVNPLGFLPEFCQPPRAPQPPLTVEQLHSVPIDPVNNPANLAQRNLLRGLRMGLPSGQDVARSMGIEPIRDRRSARRQGRGGGLGQQSDAGLDPRQLHGRAPLWYYVLAEAQYRVDPARNRQRRQRRRRAAQARHDRRAYRRRNAARSALGRWALVSPAGAELDAGDHSEHGRTDRLRVDVSRIKGRVQSPSQSQGCLYGRANATIELPDGAPFLPPPQTMTTNCLPLMR